jgi:hypothetical protein
MQLASLSSLDFRRLEAGKLAELTKSLTSIDLVGFPMLLIAFHCINLFGMKEEIAFFQNLIDDDLHSVGWSSGPGSGMPQAFTHIHLLMSLGVNATNSSCEKTWSFSCASTS